MNLFVFYRLARLRVNRFASSEAWQSMWQAMLGPQKTVGGSLVQLCFGFLYKELIRDVLHYLIKILIQ